MFQLLIHLFFLTTRILPRIFYLFFSESSPSPCRAGLIAEADKTILCGCIPQVCSPPRPVIIYSFCLIRSRVPPPDRIIFRLWQTRWQHALSLRYQRSFSARCTLPVLRGLSQNKIENIKKPQIHSQRARAASLISAGESPGETGFEISMETTLDTADSFITLKCYWLRQRRDEKRRETFESVTS